MSPSDVAGVFSRYFLVGFFLPALFALAALSEAVSAGFLPALYGDLSDSASIAVLGGAALLAGLLLLGLNWQVVRLFEGYPLAERRRRRRVIGLIHDLLMWRQTRAYEKLRNVRDGTSVRRDQPPVTDEERANAAWRLDQEFPPTKDRLLPTRFGNAVLAFESHAMKRWGLDSVGVWPRIDMLLSDRGAELLANSRSEAMFFVNGALLATLSGAILVIDQAVNEPLRGFALLAYMGPFVLALLLSRWAVGAATRWGSSVRSAIDLHRFDLYEKLGVRRPRGFSDERDVVAPKLDQALIYGHHMPDSLFAGGLSEDEAEEENK